MKRIINNIDDKVIFNSSSDKDFIEKTQRIAIENEDFDFSILGVSDAIEYIEEYCVDLRLLEIGDTVEVPDPDETDIHNHSFVGTIIDFRGEDAIIEDGDGETFQVESYRLTKLE